MRRSARRDGYQYAGLRPLDDGRLHIRTYHFVLPFHQIRPPQSRPWRKLLAPEMAGIEILQTV